VKKWLKTFLVAKLLIGSEKLSRVKKFPLFCKTQVDAELLILEPSLLPGGLLRNDYSLSLFSFFKLAVPLYSRTLQNSAYFQDLPCHF